MVVFYFMGGSNHVITNKASINVKADQATTKSFLNDIFSNKTSQWIIMIYRVPEV